MTRIGYAQVVKLLLQTKLQSIKVLKVYNTFQYKISELLLYYRILNFWQDLH